MSKTAFILLITSLFLLLIVVLVREAIWHLYIQQAQTDPEKTALIFARALGRNDFNTLETLMADELQDDLPMILANERGKYRCRNLDFNNYSDPATIRNWTNPPGYNNGVSLYETFNDGHTIGYDIYYLCGPMFARYRIAIFGLEVTMQKEKWGISKQWWLLCNYQFYNGCGP